MMSYDPPELDHRLLLCHRFDLSLFFSSSFFLFLDKPLSFFCCIFTPCHDTLVFVENANGCAGAVTRA